MNKWKSGRKINALPANAEKENGAAVPLYGSNGRFFINKTHFFFVYDSVFVNFFGSCGRICLFGCSGIIFLGK
jgi:hypothetical protein